MNIVIPMSGAGKRFLDAGYTDPKPFILVDGQPMIMRVTNNVSVRSSKNHNNIVWLVRTEHLDRAQDIQQEMRDRNIIPNATYNIIKVSGLTQGAACTVLMASGIINNDQPLIIANSDQLTDSSVDGFVEYCQKNNADGGIITFRSSADKWSYVRLDKQGILVDEVAEKVVISNLATLGIYYFRRGSDFCSAAVKSIRYNMRHRNEFYVAPVFNEMILLGKRIYHYEIPDYCAHGLGTPEDLERYLLHGRQ